MLTNLEEFHRFIGRDTHLKLETLFKKGESFELEDRENLWVFKILEDVQGDSRGGI
jgi:hypothetical protein